MAVTGLESIPKPMGLVNISGCARARNLCLPFTNPMFCVNGQILFLWVDDKRGKHFKKSHLSNSVIWKEIRYLELQENSGSNKVINFSITKIEDNHRSSLGLGHYFLFPLHKCSQVSHLSVTAAGLMQFGKPSWKFIAIWCMLQLPPRLQSWFYADEWPICGTGMKVHYFPIFHMTEQNNTMGDPRTKLS